MHEALGYTLVLDGEECKMWVELRFKEPKMLFCPCWRFLSTPVTTTLEHRVRGIPPPSRATDGSTNLLGVLTLPHFIQSLENLYATL